MSNSSKVNIGDVLYENDNYTIFLGKEEETKERQYHVVNNVTGVVEGKVKVLPQARMFADDFDKAIQDMEAEDANANSGIEVAPAMDSTLKKPH